MGLLDYIEDNWRDSYRPFTRYPKIYGEHFEQGIGLLAEEGQGWSSLYKKPLGLLNISAIPALYEAFRDEPIRNTLINDLDIDPKTAGYATQAIGLGMDVGVPYAVIRKGLTPWISEQVAKQANPTGFSPSRRRFLKGAGAAAVGTATGVPVFKQVAKTVPDLFGSTIANMSSALDTLGITMGRAAGKSILGPREGFLKSHGNLASALANITNKTADDIKKATKYDERPGIRAYRNLSVQGEAARTSGRSGSDPVGMTPVGVDSNVVLDSRSINDRIKDQFEKDWGTSTKDKLGSHARYREGSGDPLNLNIESRIQDISRESGVSDWHYNGVRQAFDDIGWARSAYNHNPKKFLAAGQEELSKLKSVRDDLIATRDSGIRESATGREGLSQRELQPRDVDYWIDYYDDLIPQLENFLKELKAGL